MLNTFPNLLTYSFFAPTLIRVTLALLLFYTAYGFTKQAKPNWFHVAGHCILGLLLLIGVYTQVVAILGALGSLAAMVWWDSLPHGRKSRTEAILLFVMFATLLLTGAGALAFDLPL